MAAQARLVIEPIGGAEAKVVAEDFFRQAEALLDCIRFAGASQNAESAQAAKFRVISLSTSSPLDALFEPEDAPCAEVIDWNSAHHRAANSISLIQAGRRPSNDFIDRPFYDALVRFCTPIGETIRKSTIRLNGSTFIVDANFRVALNDIGTAKRVERGLFIKGVVEAMNIHDSSHFFLYPSIGPSKLKCKFPKDKRDEYVRHMGKYVRVFGDFTYEFLETHPSEVHVTSVQSIPDESSIPKASDLWRIAPNATGTIRSELFVRKLRNA
jgi:hypothetical protein